MMLLLSAAMVAMRIGSICIRHEQAECRPYLGLLGADFGFLAAARLFHTYASILAFVGEALAATLLLAPRFCELFETRALSRERLGLALRIAAIRELLVPGRGSSRRRRRLELLEAVKERREGEVARQLLSAVKDESNPAEVLRLKEELATMLFLTERGETGIQFVERNFDQDNLRQRPLLVAHLLRAYGQRGDLDRAAEMMRLLEARTEPSAFVVQGGLLYLALAGEAALLRSVLTSPMKGLVPARSIRFLIEASQRYASRLESATVADRDFARDLAERVRAGSTRPLLHRRFPPATLALVAVNCFAWIALNPFSTVDEASLVRAGALFGPAVMVGEWWRPLSAMFLHAGWMHLLVNMYALFLLGRFAEGLLGFERFLLIYILSGVSGALGSLLAIRGAVSVGASGAIMGLLGTLIVVLLLRKGRLPESWRRVLLWNLVFISAIQIFVGFQMPMIDNGAHVGGLVGGAVAAIALAPDGLLGSGRSARFAVRLFLSTVFGTMLLAGMRLGSTSLAMTLMSLPEKNVEVCGVRLKVPSDWELDLPHCRVVDRYLGLEVAPVADAEAVRLNSPQANDPRAREVLNRIARSAIRLPRGIPNSLPSVPSSSSK
jgi:membrane associated rhomboid family serine protease